MQNSPSEVIDSTLNTARLRNWLQRLEAGDAAAREEIARAACERLECLARRMLRKYG